MIRARTKVITGALLIGAGLAIPAQAQVKVILDLDLAKPGIQSERTIPPGNVTVASIGVHIISDIVPKQPSIAGIGYVGGIDRGIALGHALKNALYGKIVSITGEVGAPINPAATAMVEPDFAHIFDGPAVHYLEHASSPAPIPTSIGKPVFTVEVKIEGGQAGDVFELFVLDAVSANFGKGGAFSSEFLNQLDSGGDEVPDGTKSFLGLDLDKPVPVPPAAFTVDYIDGDGGARLVVGEACKPDCDQSGTLNIDDFICFSTLFALQDPAADCDLSGSFTIDDFICFQTFYAFGC